MTTRTDAPADDLEKTMTKEGFCARFVTEMMTALPIYGGTEAELREYAEEVAPSYWEEEWQREEGPEACAQSDIGYWEEG